MKKGITALMVMALFLTGCHEITSENDQKTSSSENVVATEKEKEKEEETSLEEIYDGKLVRVYHGLPTSAIDVNQEVYINQYLNKAGCDFRIKLVGNDTEYGYEEYLVKAKDAGEIVDIEYGFFDDNKSRMSYVEKAEAGEYYVLNDMLETDMGKKLISGLNQYMTPENNNEKTLDYLEQYRMKDGNIYGVPMYVNFSAPYFLCFDKAILDKYGVETLTGDIADIDKVLEKSDEMIRDNVTPVGIRCILDNIDKLFGSLYGYEPYEVFWLLKQSESGKVEALNVFEDENLLSWYQKLGKIRNEGKLGLFISELTSGYDKCVMKDTDDENRKNAIIFIPGAEDCIGYIRSDIGEIGYDILNVETYFPIRTTLCINKISQYPDECFEFLTMLFYDTEFRRLMNLGPENIGYKVTEENGKKIIQKYNGMVGIPMGLGLGEDYLIYQKYDNEDYHMYQEKIYEGNTYAKRSMIGLSKEIDLSSVKTEFEACNRIFTENTPTFWGVYGDNTNDELDKLYKILVDAGYLNVLAEINRQLGD